MLKFHVDGRQVAILPSTVAEIGEEPVEGAKDLAVIIFVKDGIGVGKDGVPCPVMRRYRADEDFPTILSRWRTSFEWGVMFTAEARDRMYRVAPLAQAPK